MLNILWPIFMVISIVYSIFTGNIEVLNKSIFESIDNVVQFTLTLVGITCFWTGIMAIASKTSTIKFLTRLLQPIIKMLFPNMKSNNEANKSIVMNIVANILGLGNAATPLGLKAMNDLQKENTEKQRLSDNMMMLIVLNTASLQVIPTTVLAIRSSLDSGNPNIIIFPVWIATICAAIVGIIATKFLIKIEK